MAGRLIFLLEEPSMKSLLDALLPRLVPGWVIEQHLKCVPHQGKNDLDISVPRKLSNWRIAGDRFVIVRDNDNADYADIKARYARLCAQAGRPDTLVRLVCQELESWYIGDLAALAAGFKQPALNSPALRKRFRDPDVWQKPSRELSRLIPTFQKTSAARTMGVCMSLDHNSSRSFQVFVQGVRRLAADLQD